MNQLHFYYMMVIYTLAIMHLDFMASDIPHEMVSHVNNACESWIYVYCLALNRSVWSIWTMKSVRLRRYNSFIAFHPAVVVDGVLLWELCECVCVWQAMFVSVASLFHSLSNIHSHPSQSLNRPAMKHKSDVFFVPNNQINQTAGPCTPWLHIIFWKEQIWKTNLI